MTDRYTIGLDYGTLSARAVVVRVRDGAEMASAVFEYPHGVMDRQLPSGKRLPVDWALQHPQDYLDALCRIIPQAVAAARVPKERIIGIGIDFTASTAMPILQDGTPLCFLPEYQDEPHAYIKLWKHHAAQDKANALTDLARARGEAWLARYGGKVSSEWVFPKLWQLVEEAPEIYDKMDYWIEAGDWLVWKMTGKLMYNACIASYKAFYSKRDGFPSPDFFAAANPRLRNVVEEKFPHPIMPTCARAGCLTEAMAEKLGLMPGTAVAVDNGDGHIAMTTAGIDHPGRMLMIMGTSTCHMLLGTEEKIVPGMCGVAEDGLMPGFMGFESGQSCVGDHFAWLVEHCCPASYFEEAKKQGVSIHQYLTSLASRLAPGESGLLALDWWNGNRSVLVDMDLTGLMLGMTLQTTCEEMYRALIEATAYGTRVIVENFRASGVPVDTICASGGISRKNPMMMQIYADVLNMPIDIVNSVQGPALGSAIHGAVAAGKASGGYDNVYDAVHAMVAPPCVTYTPIPENVAVYEKLYQEYKLLHDYFGRGGNDVMKRLKEIKKQAK